MLMLQFLVLSIQLLLEKQRCSMSSLYTDIDEDKYNNELKPKPVHSEDILFQKELKTNFIHGYVVGMVNE